MFKDVLLDILLPKKCLGCKKEGSYICDNCEIFLSEAPNLIEAKLRSSNVMSVWEYEGLIEKAILKIKYEGCHHIINELVEKAFQKIELNLPLDTYITYVPMYKKRERQRGFNQAELIAKKVGEKTGREVIPLLIKIKDNLSQVGLDPEQRINNIKNVFQKKEGSAFPSNILIIDDFLVSGATIKECSRILKDSGVNNVWSFVLARKV